MLELSEALRRCLQQDSSPVQMHAYEGACASCPGVTQTAPSCTAAATGSAVDVCKNISARILLGTLSVDGGSREMRVTLTLRINSRQHCRSVCACCLSRRNSVMYERRKVKLYFIPNWDTALTGGKAWQLLSFSFHLPCLYEFPLQFHQQMF